MNGWADRKRKASSPSLNYLAVIDAAEPRLHLLEQSRRGYTRFGYPRKAFL
jgi:hypothetical protein